MRNCTIKYTSEIDVTQYVPTVLTWTNRNYKSHIAARDLVSNCICKDSKLLNSRACETWGQGPSPSPKVSQNQDNCGLSNNLHFSMSINAAPPPKYLYLLPPLLVLGPRIFHTIQVCTILVYFKEPKKNS